MTAVQIIAIASQVVTVTGWFVLAWHARKLRATVEGTAEAAQRLATAVEEAGPDYDIVIRPAPGVRGREL